MKGRCLHATATLDGGCAVRMHAIEQHAFTHSAYQECERVSGVASTLTALHNGVGSTSRVLAGQESAAVLRAFPRILSPAHVTGLPPAAAAIRDSSYTRQACLGQDSLDKVARERNDDTRPVFSTFQKRSLTDHHSPLGRPYPGCIQLAAQSNRLVLITYIQCLSL